MQDEVYSAISSVALGISDDWSVVPMSDKDWRQESFRVKHKDGRVLRFTFEHALDSVNSVLVEVSKAEVQNESGIIPMGYKVLVKPIEVKEVSDGGVWFPEESKEKDEFARTEGHLVAVSDGAFTYNYYGFPDDGRKPMVGDRVIFARYNAQQIKGQDGIDYWMMTDSSIAGVMSDG